MNYIKQLNGFWNWAIINTVSQGEISLYLAILHCANLSNWQHNINLPNSTLMALADIGSVTQLCRIRNKLEQLGLINYIKGKKGAAGTYKIRKLYDDVINSLSDGILCNLIIP